MASVRKKGDSTLTVLKHYINIGWLCEREMVPQELHPYWNFREDLIVGDGLVPKGSKLLMPSTLHQKVLEQIHEGHQGMKKCMLKARESVFRPELVMTFEKLWKSMEFANLLLKLPNQLEMSVKFTTHVAYPWN